jgi:hypothetical protein
MLRIYLSRIIFIGVLAATSLVADTAYTVSINTSGLTSDVGYLEWDLTSGGGAPFNVVGIEGFTSDGTLGDATTQVTIGNVCPDTYPSPCSPPTGYVYLSPVTSVVMIDDPIDNPYNVYAIAFTFGTYISFTINATQNGPGAGSNDELSFFLYESDDATPLITTNDPSGDDSLLDLDIDGSTNGTPFVYPSTDGSDVTATMTSMSSGGSSVPEPSTWPVLAAIALLAGLARLGRVLKARRLFNLTLPANEDSLG